MNTAAAHHALSLLSSSCPLPNLKRLHWTRADPSTFHYIRQYLHPRLEALYINFDISHPEQVGILFTIPALYSPHISALRIPPRFRPSCDPIYFSRALPAWSHLSILIVPDITLEGLICVAQMPHLKELAIYELLSLWICPFDAPLSTRTKLLQSITTLERTFPVLEDLDITTRGLSIVEVTKLIALFHEAELHKLKLNINYLGDTMDDTADLFQAVRDHCSTSSLEELILLHADLPPTSFSVIQPLLSFHKLKALHICGGHHMSLSEQETAQIAKSLPDIKEFITSVGMPEPPNNLLALIPFTACSKLQRLSISLDASDKATRNALRKRTNRFSVTQNFALRVLNVGDSPISHKEFVASFLSDIFPNLEDIKHVCFEETHTRRWNHIGNVLLPMLRRARNRQYCRMSPETLPVITKDVVPQSIFAQRREAFEEHDGDWSDEEEVGVNFPFMGIYA